jgi:hypothetical protein
VTKAKLHKNAVVSKKVKNHSLKCKDLKKGCVAGPKGPAGPAGPAGATGPAGLGGAKISTDNLGSIDQRAGVLGSNVNSPANKVLASSDGFAWVLVCPASPPGSFLAVVNVSGGENSHIEVGPDAAANNDFDEGQANAQLITQTTFDNDERERERERESKFVLICGTAGGGTTQEGMGGVLNNPGSGQFTGNPDCVGSVNMLAG